MASFSYQARDASGATHKGVIEAASVQDAARKLKANRLFPVEVRPTRRSGAKKVPGEQVIRFFLDLADLLAAGLPLDRALALVSAGQTHPRFKRVVGEIFDEVQGGADLSDQTAKYRDVFGDLAPHMLKAGESTGTLAVIAKRIGEHLERKRAFRQALVSAMVYPCMLLVMSLLSVLVLLLYVIPKFAQVFETLQQEVPTVTRILLDTGTFLSEWGFVIPLVLALGWMLARSALKRPEVQLGLARRLAGAPVAGRLLVYRELSRFCQTLGTMIQGGVPVVRALGLVEGVVGNLAVRERLSPLRGQIKAGRSMSEFFKKDELFPPRLATMVRIGEEQGNVGEVLVRLGDYFESEFQQAMKRLLTVLEPMVIIVTGLIIGVMVMSMFSAIFGINDIQF